MTHEAEGGGGSGGEGGGPGGKRTVLAAAHEGVEREGQPAMGAKPIRQFARSKTV